MNLYCVIIKIISNKHQLYSDFSISHTYFEEFPLPSFSNFSIRP